MSLTLYTLRAVAASIVTSTSFLVFLILAVIFYKQNKKTSLMQKVIVGKSINTPVELTASQLVIGIVGAIISSLMLSYLGVIFHEDSGIEIMFLLSIIFMIFNPRLICFSYSASALGFISLILNQFSIALNDPTMNFLKIDIVSLMTLVAVLHFVEGLMVIIDGSRGAVPVFTNKDGKITGGFILRRYWAVPVSILIVGSGFLGFTAPITKPGWWPLIKSQYFNSFLKTATLGITSFYGIIGYNSITFTKSKEDKAITSGLYIIIYSLLLFILAQMAKINYFLKIIVLFFAPIGHEAMLFMQRYSEIKSDPIYVSNDEGMRVLEVAPDSLAENMGIESGDLLININDKNINSEKDITEEISQASNYIRLKWRKISGELKELTYKKITDAKSLGVVLVPKSIPQDVTMMKFDGYKFKQILDEKKKQK